jgi:hypothetical protein
VGVATSQTAEIAEIAEIKSAFRMGLPFPAAVTNSPSRRAKMPGSNARIASDAQGAMSRPTGFKAGRVIGNRLMITSIGTVKILPPRPRSSSTGEGTR